MEDSGLMLRAPALRTLRLRSGHPLWRLFTGRATLADLGFRGPPAAAEAIVPEPAAMPS